MCSIKLWKQTMVLWVILLVEACVKDKPNVPDYGVPNLSHRGVMIANEGALGMQNAELSWLDLDTRLMFNQLIRNANGFAPGDVLQHLIFHQGRYLITLNRSNQVRAYDAFSLQETGRIEGIASPRYLIPVNAVKGYISCLYSPRLYVIDLVNMNITDTIETPYLNTESMCLFQDRLWVSTWDTSSSYILGINTTTDSITDMINWGGRAAHSLVLDKMNHLWVLGGNPYLQIPSTLSNIHLASKQVIQTFTFDPDADPIKLTLHPHGDTLYYLQVDYNGVSPANGLYKMDIQASTLPGKPFIPANTHTYFWGIGIDPLTQHIFLSDPKGFTQQSTIYEYLPNGNLWQTYKAGIGANQFLFR